MGFFQGITYNIKGLLFSLKSPKLLILGIVRFVAVLILTIISATLILAYHQQVLNLIWAKPQSHWIIWLWHVVSWLLSFLLVGISAVISYLVAQILFSVVIMDIMSRITERKVKGQVEEPRVSLFRLFGYLVRQEIPRTTIPVLISLVLIIVGWIIPLGPILVLISSLTAVIFLSWDNTDLVPARRMLPFKERFKLLLKTLSFHLGFGLPFLVPGANIIFLSFAPVGATLYHIEKEASQTPSKTNTRLSS
ncbi:MAG: hypothetical protein DRH12_10775 [Deltaproteobacteria bacterium]|nr:MAG: hypothetical protein DRH12_10775 [Deltaproteobacteria bacterium]RLB79840.1 MAG: hypothetical protein DRH15_08355 [Deltaproteobacteria bacterium]